MDWGEFLERGVFEAFFEWIVPTVSLMLLGLVVGLIRLEVDRPLFYAVDLFLPALFVTLIVWQALELHEADLPAGRRRTVATWYALGIYTMIGLSGWTILLSLLGQSTVPVSVEVLTEVVAGGFFGLLVGVAQVRAQQNAEEATEAQLEQEFLERQQETNEVLNRILRHHLLNGLTVIQGQAQLLEDHVDPAGEEHRQRVREEAGEMADTIEEIRKITRTLTEEPDLAPVELGAVLDAQLERVRATYPQAEFELNGTGTPDVTVEGNELLGRALANVLHNAIDHNTADQPAVEVSVTDHDDAVELAVADNGPGIPDDRKEMVLQASERGLDSDGEGLGLFLTKSVLRQYGGEVRVGDNEPTGTVVTLRLPKA